MPKQIFGAESVVTTLNRAFNDISPSNATFNNQVAAAGTTTDSYMAFAKTFGAGFAGLSADALSTKLLGNLGVLPNAALQTALKDYITAAGVSNVGIIALQLGDILSGLENATGDQAGFAAAALAWNNEVTAAYNYSANPANTGPSDSGNAQPGTTFTLVVGADNLAPNSAVVANKTSAGDDTIRAVTALSLETVDVIDGGSGNDTLAVSAGALGAASTPVLKSVETIAITSIAADTLNLASATGVTAINVTATNAASVVTVNNIATLDTVIGTGLSTTAGVIDVDFTASTAGTNDTLKVALGNNNAFAATIQSTVDTATFENITIAANGSKSGTSVAGNNAADVVIFNNGNFNTVKTLTVTGEGNSNITTASAALKTVTASAANGNNTYVLAGAAGKTVTTGSGNDTVTTGAGDDTVTTGLGNDTISAAAGTNKYVGGLGADTYTGDAAGTDSFSIETSTIEDLGFDTVLAGGFTTAVDTLIFVGGPAAAAANYVEVTTAGTGFVSARSSALTSLAASTDVKYVAVQDAAGDTYVFFDGNGDHLLNTNGADFTVKLTGVGIAAIAAGDIVVA